ncbi:MAG: DNA polymerase Y family protein [Xanthobacteraceae bacterium]
MSRIVSVWLPHWPITRFLAAQALAPTNKPVDPDRPFVLAIAASGGLHIAALNEAAEAAGLTTGESLADARAKADRLQVREVDAAADDAALRRIALWATRYTPTASPWGEENGADGFFLDIEGAAHLFGGEDKLIADLAARLENFGLPARLAVAATAGTAWALSHFHNLPLFVLPTGDEASALADMPVEALRLTPDIRATLRRLGFKTVGALLDQPRAPFAARFAEQLLRRLDQARGLLDEPLAPIVAPPVYHSLHYLPEPIFTQEAVIARASRLMQTLANVLTRDDAGARALRLSLYRVDGAVETVDIGLTLSTRNVSHVVRLFDLKLATLAATHDADFSSGLGAEFGYEAIGLAITRAEPMPARQIEIGSTALPGTGNAAEDYAALIDTLRGRLGPQRVRRFEPVASHIPEHAEILAPVDGEAEPTGSNWPQAEEDRTRPLLLLPQAEPTEVTALVPDGPPRRFCWRGVTYYIAGSQGPERIGAQWWRTPHGETRPTRDYYLVEDFGGHRFWLYREGLYGRETMQAQWYVHGLFA